MDLSPRDAFRLYAQGTHQATKANFVLLAEENCSCNCSPFFISTFLCLPVQYCYFKTFHLPLPITITWYPLFPKPLKFTATKSLLGGHYMLFVIHRMFAFQKIVANSIACSKNYE